MLHRMKSVNNNGGLFGSNQQRIQQQQLRHAKSLPNINKGRNIATTLTTSIKDKQKKSFINHDKRPYTRLSSSNSSTTSISTIDTNSKDLLDKHYNDYNKSTKNVLLSNTYDNSINIYHSHILVNTSWTIYVSDDTNVLYGNDQSSQLSSSNKQTVFRLVRNSEPQSSLYLYGIEILHCIDGIYERDNNTTFTIHSSNSCCGNKSNTSSPKEIYYANSIHDIRNKLYQSLGPIENTHSIRKKSYRHIIQDIDVDFMLLPKLKQKDRCHPLNDDLSKVFHTIPTNIDLCFDDNDDDTSSFINFINEEYDLSSMEHFEANESTQHQMIPLPIPLIESTIEFDDDDNDSTSINYFKNDFDESNTNFLWDDTMIQDVVSSLIAVGVYDTSIASSSLWNTLSASESSLSLSLSNSSEEDNNDKHMDQV